VVTSSVSRVELEQLVAENRVLGTLPAAAQRLVADALEPVALPGGAVLMREGDAADCLYLVGAGRLRVTVTGEDGVARALAEVGRGDLVGEMALITDRPRSATVHAVRDSHLLRLSVEAFTALTSVHPEAVRVISTGVVEKLMRSQASGPVSTPVITVAVVPLDPEPAVLELAGRLERAVATIVGSVCRVGSRAAVEAVGPELDGRALAAWCSDLEAASSVVLLEADAAPSAWTDTCIRQADLLLLVAAGGASPELRPIEQVVPRRREVPHSRTELVLVHPSWTADPRGTERWLDRRGVQRHHHVRAGRDADVAHVARLVAGKATGLVYSGGGARGIAEIGVLRALREAGVPIDAVGGTSIGSIVAGGTARGLEPDAIADLLRAALVAGRSPVDVTFPVVSIAAGSRVTQHMQHAAGGLDMADTWTDFFCVSTNLTRGEVMVHRRGPAWFALRASFSIPGVFPPMRTADGEVLVDGGDLDNRPVATMRALHEGVNVVAVDVGSRRDVTAGALPESGVVSGWRWLLGRVNPRAETPEMAGLVRVLMRLTELGAGRAPDRGDLYIRPEVEDVAMLDFKAFDRLLELGHEAGCRALEAAPGRSTTR
jgi:predicted acylesterase/phospholipase RssA